MFAPEGRQLSGNLGKPGVAVWRFHVLSVALLDAYVTSPMVGAGSLEGGGGLAGPTIPPRRLYPRGARLAGYPRRAGYPQPGGRVGASRLGGDTRPEGAPPEGAPHDGGYPHHHHHHHPQIVPQPPHPSPPPPDCGGGVPRGYPHHHQRAGWPGWPAGLGSGQPSDPAFEQSRSAAPPIYHNRGAGRYPTDGLPERAIDASEGL